MHNPFTHHPTSVGETYWEHQRFAARFGARMAWGGAAALVHSLLPFCCVTTASRINDELTQMRAASRGRTVLVVDMATMQPLDWHIQRMQFKRMHDVDVRGKRVFIRADLNVPQDAAGNITDDTRIRASLPGIRDALVRGAAVMVTSHLGRPAEGEWRETDSLAPVAARLAQLLDRDVPLVRDWVDGGAWLADLAPGQVVLLENCRINRGEKQDDAALATRMAALCDVYVNDAFGTAHRAKATTHGLALTAAVACAGPLMAAELDALTLGLAHPRHPLVAIVGGSKVSTKLTILRTLAARVDTLIVGGGIANTFLLAAGMPIGKSLAEPDLVAEARAILTQYPRKVPLPIDVVCATTFAADAVATTKLVADVADDDLILDLGPASMAQLAHVLTAAGTIVWNGPVGVFEFAAFSHGTEALGRGVAHSAAYSIAGGGDTVAAINHFDLAAHISYISTAGGAFLEFLEGKTLPAVAALEARA